MWVSPVQVKILPIGDEHVAYARELSDRMTALGMRVQVDDRNEKIGYKIRQAQLSKIPYMLVIGDKEVQSGTVSVRSRKLLDMGSMPAGEAIAMFRREIEEKAK